MAAVSADKLTYHSWQLSDCGIRARMNDTSFNIESSPLVNAGTWFSFIPHFCLTLRFAVQTEQQRVEVESEEIAAEIEQARSMLSH
jgi:hypothetical protein